MTLALVCVLFAFGLILGSFFNVLIYRLPRNESILWPSSHCPHCNRKIRAFENIPLVSFLLLRGKCRGCEHPISLQYPLVECATGIALVIAGSILLGPEMRNNIHGFQWVTPVVSITMLLLLIPMSIIDWRLFIIPDSFTLGPLVVGIGIAFIPGGISPLDSLIGALVGG
ncbi:MAG: prepilin peptidase, partial [Chitinivibrionales bacterium]|nr:prepilin peptidase [Chitinivibrionales bacterium]